MKLMPTSKAFATHASACARSTPPPYVSHEPRLISETSRSLDPKRRYSTPEALASSAMRTRRLGRDGPEVSVVGLGCNNFGMRVDLDETRAVVEAALDAGVTLFDTADIYGDKGGSESFLGEALEGRRDRVVLATKFGGDMGDGTEARGSRPYIRKAIDASLARLRTDYVDVYQ